MNLGGLSLIFLLIAIALGFFKKMNTGLVAIGLALVIGRIGGIGDKAIVGGFSGKLFVMLLGVTYLFSMAQVNGILELFARKVVALAGKRTNLIPIVIYLLATFLSAIGPGTIPVMALMAVFTMALAAEMKVSPLLLAPMGLLGAMAGGISPIAPNRDHRYYSCCRTRNYRNSNSILFKLTTWRNTICSTTLHCSKGL
jgi:di/tricarboxylate transporter